MSYMGEDGHHIRLPARRHVPCQAISPQQHRWDACRRYSCKKPEQSKFYKASAAQGGCMALEDAVTLAATLRDTCHPTGKPGNADMAAAFAGADPAAIAEALRAMECERTARCAPLVEMASQNGKRSIMPSSLPVRGPPSRPVLWQAPSPLCCRPCTLVLLLKTGTRESERSVEPSGLPVRAYICARP